MPQKIKVVMLTHDYLPKGGGIETQLATITPVLQQDYNTEVHIVTRKYPELPAYEEINGIPVHRMKLMSGKALASLSYTVKSIQTLHNLKPDIIHAHSFISPTTTALLSNLLSNYPLVLSSHRSGELGDIQRLKRRKLGLQQIQWMRQRVNSFIAISHEIKEELREIGIGEDQICYIPNAVDTEKFKPISLAAKKALRKKLNLPQDAPITIFTGRLNIEKRVNHLINIWSDIRKNYPDAFLCILGTGSEEDNLKEMAGEGILFTGRVSNVSEYLQASDIFVLPSIAEGLSVSMLEAMASGLASVVTNIGGASDVITHQENGFLIEADNVPILQSTLNTLLGDKTLRTDIGNAAHQHIVDHFGVDVIVKQWRDLYQKIIATT